MRTAFLNYNLKDFKSDLSAGMLVATVGFPSVMAFALLAGLNPVYGLYSFIVAAIVGTFVGASHYIVMGPTNVVALMIANALGAFAVTGPEKIKLVLLLTFMAGVIQVILSFLNFAKIANFISRSVISGLTAGIAFIIAVSQLVKVLGLEAAGKSAILSLYRISANLRNINPYTLFVALVTISTIWVIRKVSRKAPAYLLGIFLSVAVVYVFGLQSQISMVGSWEGSFPGLSFPPLNFELATKLFSYAFAIAILGFIQILTLAEFNQKGAIDQEQIDKELCGLGVANTACSFFNGFAGGGSYSRSFTNHQAGAETRFSQLIAGIFVLLLLLFFGSTIRLLPIATLGALLIFIALKMVDWKRIKIMLTTKRFDALIFTATFAATILMPRLDYAVYLAILFSLLMVVRGVSQPNYSFLEINGKEVEQKEPEQMKDKEEMIVDLSGNLHFNKVNKIKNELQKALQVGDSFIIRMRNVEQIDITVMEQLEEFIDKTREGGGEVFFAGLSEEIKKDFEQYGLTDKLGEENFFTKDEELFASSKSAVKEAKKNKVNKDKED